MRTVADLDWTFNDLLIYLWGRSYCVICVDNWYYIKADQFRQGAEEVPARLLVVEIRFCHQHLCVWKKKCILQLDETGESPLKSTKGVKNLKLTFIDPVFSWDKDYLRRNMAMINVAIMRNITNVCAQNFSRLL